MKAVASLLPSQPLVFKDIPPLNMEVLSSYYGMEAVSGRMTMYISYTDNVVTRHSPKAKIETTIYQKQGAFLGPYVGTAGA